MQDAIYSYPKYKKKVLSRILMYEGKRDWVNIEDKKPEFGDVVIIRLCDNTKMVAENDLHVMVLEDMKVAKYTEEGWKILPPHPLFDYSPLSNKEIVNDDALVTHWAVANEDALKAWECRFKRIREYKHLKIETDDENLELVYRALLHGAHAIAAVCDGNIDSSEEYRPLYEVLSDLQAYLDETHQKE